MKITRPIDGVDLVIVYDLIPDEDVQLLRDYWRARHYYINSLVEQAERSYLKTIPAKASLALEKAAQEVIEQIKKSSERIMHSEYPDLNLVRFAYFGGISIRNPITQPSMKPHVDGPPEYNTPKHGIKNLGANFYLNDDFDGGELYYPELNFSFKPVPNSLVIHRGLPLFLHGVAEVTSGWRLSFGMFAYEYYDAPPLKMGLDSDR